MNSDLLDRITHYGDVLAADRAQQVALLAILAQQTADAQAKLALIDAETSVLNQVLPMLQTAIGQLGDAALAQAQAAQVSSGS
jgi:hypothetical protein